jgi:hypothetical protein
MLRMSDKVNDKFVIGLLQMRGTKDAAPLQES